MLLFSENLKALREEKGLSQEELAIKLSVVRQTVSKWEKGLSTPDADMLLKLAEVLGTSVSVLVGESALNESEPHPEAKSPRKHLSVLEIVLLYCDKHQAAVAGGEVIC
jgi:putative transcriptional regulator